MEPTRRARIVIEDLPGAEPLTPEEMARIQGAGRVRPSFEQLEDRQVMSVNAPAIATALTHSAENYANIIRQAYQQYLGRQPDAAGLSAWVSAMQNGLSDEHLEAGFIGSPEYIADHGGTGPEWVKGMYHDLLGREPDAAGVSAWVQALQNGLDPTKVAYGFAASAEREGQRVTADYQNFLGRSPSPDEVAGWVNGFVNGLRNEDVVAGFVGSPEYYAGWGQGNDVMWLTRAYQSILGRVPSVQEVQQTVGLPPDDGQAVAGLPGANVVQFQGQDIYWSAATGAHALSGPLAAAYAATANLKDAYGHPVQQILGLPTGDEQDVAGVPGARMVHFQGGDIYWSAATGAHAVYGAIGARYASLGGPSSALGLPTGDEQDVPGVAGARAVSFQGGSISWSAAAGAHAVYGGTGAAGVPVVPSQSGGNSAPVATGAPALSGPIGAAYAATANLKDAYGKPVQQILGRPTGDEQDVPGVAGARVVHFQGGDIYWSAATGAHGLYGAIGTKYNLARLKDTLGMPVGDVTSDGIGNFYQNFQGGAILQTADGHAFTSLNGPIRDRWAQQGFEGGPLGMPTSDDQQQGGHGMRYQNFQGGAIVQTPDGHAYVSPNGAIRTAWAQQGFENGPLGMPTGDEQPVPGVAGARVVHFQGGDIYWSASAGAHVVYSAISNLGGITAQFTMESNSHVIQTIGGHQTDLGSGFQLLLQGHDGAGHKVVYFFGNGHLYQFGPTPNPNWIKLGSPARDDIVQDQSQNLFFLEGDNVLQATGNILPDGSPETKQIVAGAAALRRTSGGQLLLLHTDGTVWLRNSDGSWTQIGQGGVESDGSIWYLGLQTVDAAGDRAVYRLLGGRLDALPGASRMLTAGLNDHVYSSSGEELYTWVEGQHAWVDAASLVTPTAGGLGLTSWNDVIPSTPSDAQDKWNHIVGQAGQLGQAAVGTLENTAVMPVATAGAQGYLADAAAMQALYAGRRETLSAADKRFLHAAFPDVYTHELLDSVHVYYGCTLSDGTSAGMTFGHEIYLHPNLADMEDRERLTLIGHELIHAIQYDRLGQNLFAFGYEYFQEYAKSLASNGSQGAVAAYRGNSMEQEAYAMQDKVGAVYDQSAVTLMNKTGQTLSVQVTFEVPTPNPPPGLYLVPPATTQYFDLTLTPGQSTILYAGDNLLPVDQILRASGTVHVHATASWLSLVPVDNLPTWDLTINLRSGPRFWNLT